MDTDNDKRSSKKGESKIALPFGKGKPSEAIVRDWPPPHGVYLKYKPTGTYLSIKSGELELKPSTTTLWNIVAVAKGTYIRCNKKKIFLVIASTGVCGLANDRDDPFEWTLRPKVINDVVYIDILCRKDKPGMAMRPPQKLVGNVEDREMQTIDQKNDTPLWILEVPSELKVPTYSCPACSCTGMTEDDFWYHWPQVHGRLRPTSFPCPICIAVKDDHNPYGDPNWGYGNHLFHNHGPPARKPPSAATRKPIYAFSLVIIQHPVTKKFVLIEEGADSGWWLPAGGVDPGETFEEAAIRECIEEAGIEVVLKGILAFENSPRSTGGGRQRMIFYAHPKNPDEPLKSIPDYESLRAVWISASEMMDDIKSRKIHLRGHEPAKWFPYVEDDKAIFPMSLLWEGPGH